MIIYFLLEQKETYYILNYIWSYTENYCNKSNSSINIDIAF